jgi:hypothetical protein
LRNLQSNIWRSIISQVTFLLVWGRGNNSTLRTCLNFHSSCTLHKVAILPDRHQLAGALQDMHHRVTFHAGVLISEPVALDRWLPWGSCSATPFAVHLQLLGTFSIAASADGLFSYPTKQAWNRSKLSPSEPQQALGSNLQSEYLIKLICSRLRCACLRTCFGDHR